MKSEIKVPHNAQQTLILRDELRQLWSDRDVFAEVQQLDGEVAREVPGRQTLRFTLQDKVYYRKLHTGVGWREIFKNLIRLRAPVIGARNEWEALNRLAELQVPSLTPVAYGEKFGNPARRLSFIVTRELSGTQELDKYLLACRQENPLTFRNRQALILALAGMARALHAGGINHRDFYLCHFLLDLDSVAGWRAGTSAPRLYLVDLHRAQLREQVPLRWQVKDLASLYFSAMDLGVTRADVCRFLKAYFAQPLALIQLEQADLLERVERRARQLYKREQRLKARGLRD